MTQHVKFTIFTISQPLLQNHPYFLITLKTPGHLLIVSTVIGNRMMNRVKWKFFACFVPSVDDFVTKCYFDILFDFLMTKIIIEPKVGLVDVTMHPFWNFQSNICHETKTIQEKVIFVISEMSLVATKLTNVPISASLKEVLTLK